MTESTNSVITTVPKGKQSFFKEHPRRTILLAVIVLLVLAGGSVYFVQARQAAAASAAPAPQTATVRRGNLTISASGAGTLVASDQQGLAFSTSGQVTGVFVKPGDYVEAGTLLAQIESQQAQIDYIQAKHTYQELTSAAGIATAQEQVAQAQAGLRSAKLDLEYLISPDVMYWEAEIAKSQATLEQAQATADASPSNQDAQQALQKAKEFLSFAQSNLDQAWTHYHDDYVPETFQLAEDQNGNDYYIVPTDLEIKLARAKIDEAQNTLNDSQGYYAVLTGAPMPEDASSDALVQLQKAELDYQKAQATLDGTKITAPISGTILSVDVSFGNTADTSKVITMADLSQLELDFYMDETEWDLVSVGNQAQVSFDALPDQTFNGQVTQVDTELYQSNNTSAVKGIVQFDNTTASFNLPIGTSATIKIIHAQVDNAVLVPIEALHETTPGKYVVNLDENGTLTQRDVEIGQQDQFYAEVKSGLQAGDVVSTDSVNTD